MLPNAFKIKLHSQTSAVIDAYHPLRLINATSIWQNDKPTDICSVLPANISHNIRHMLNFHEKNSLVNTSAPIFRF